MIDYPKNCPICDSDFNLRKSQYIGYSKTGNTLIIVALLLIPLGLLFTPVIIDHIYNGFSSGHYKKAGVFIMVPSVLLYVIAKWKFQVVRLKCKSCGWYGEFSK
jgi:hypothetical protein